MILVVSAGWTGDHCSLQTETECQDGVDNDKGKVKVAERSLKGLQMGSTLLVMILRLT